MLRAMRLGIDFGTTRTVVAAVQDGRHPVAAFDEGGEFREHVPGIAALRDGGAARRVGSSARARGWQRGALDPLCAHGWS